MKIYRIEDDKNKRQELWKEPYIVMLDERMKGNQINYQRKEIIQQTKIALQKNSQRLEVLFFRIIIGAIFGGGPVGDFLTLLQKNNQRVEVLFFRIITV